MCCCASYFILFLLLFDSDFVWSAIHPLWSCYKMHCFVCTLCVSMMCLVAYCNLPNVGQSDVNCTTESNNCADVTNLVFTVLLFTVICAVICACFLPLGRVSWHEYHRLLAYSMNELLSVAVSRQC